MKRLDNKSNWFGLIRQIDKHSNTNSTVSRIGTATPLRDEPVRLGSTTQLSFPAKDIDYLEQQGSISAIDHGRWGLTGSMGALPYHYSELAHSKRQKASAFKQFTDIFNHRSLSLLYKTWKKYRIYVDKEYRLNHTQEEPNSYTAFLSSISGLSENSLVENTRLSQDIFLTYSGLLSRQVRTTEGLRLLLNHHFRMTFDIQEFIPKWVELSNDMLSTLGERQQNNVLGVSCVIGKRTRMAQPFFRVLILSPSQQQFLSLMPGGDTLYRLQLLTQLYTGAELSFDIEIQITDHVLPLSRLGARNNAPSLLGWNTLLGARRNEQQLHVRISKNYVQPKRRYG